MELANSAKAPGTMPVPNVVSLMLIWQWLGPLSRGFLNRWWGTEKTTLRHLVCTSIDVYIPGDVNA
jgi:hypothetical protein